MNDQPVRHSEALFYEALELPEAARAAFLDAACRDDAAVRAEVAELLRMHGDAIGFLHEDAPAPAEREAEIASLQPEAAGSSIGPYKLLEKIGEGGFGTVWVAAQEIPVRRRVALKILKPGMDSREVIARFEQERQALAMMDHPNIARVLDAGATERGRPYFVMELVRGIKITSYCDRAKLPTTERLRLVIAVCHAVQHAHQKGVIHRDLKPSNILVTLHDGVAVPKVIDFGIAKATQQQRLTDLTIYTQFEQMVGTPLYMSPEQAEMSGLDIDTRSDIYSLGVLLYELLVGRTPFDPETLMKRGIDEIRRAVRDQEPQKPSTFVSTMALDLRTNVAQHRQTDEARLVGQIRGDLDWIVMKALEKDRTRRYETANGLALDIQRHLRSEPVEARPPTAGYRFLRFARRHRVAFAAGAAVLAALAAGGVVATWQAVRAKSALNQLRATAPAFADQARTLASREKFDEAIEKIGYATELRPDVPAYALAKADLLQSQLRFAEAVPLYRKALHLDPSDPRAAANIALSDKFAQEMSTQPQLSRPSLLELYNAMTQEQRPAAELMRVGTLLGQENDLLLAYWLDRLKDLPVPPETPLKQRLTANHKGELAFDLSSTEIEDLRLLEGMPLHSLDLTRCDKVVDLTPLVGMPLVSINLTRTDVIDLEPLRQNRTLQTLLLSKTKVEDLAPLAGQPLEELDLSATRVQNLTPLTGMPLRSLRLRETPVDDISPLKSMPLRILDLAFTKVNDITPIAGMPLEYLDCSLIPATDFSPIAGLQLKELTLYATRIKDLSALAGMPLTSLNLDSCGGLYGFKHVANLVSLLRLTMPHLGGLSDQEFEHLGAVLSLPQLQAVSLGGIDLKPVSKDEFRVKYEQVATARRNTKEIIEFSRSGQHAKAAEILKAMIANHQLTKDYDVLSWMNLATTLLADGNLEEYRSACKEMLTRFRRRGAGDENTVRMCLLSAESSVPIADLRRLMPHMALIRKETDARCWFVFTNGLLEYRDGRIQNAIDFLEKVETDLVPACLCGAAATLSMAYCRTGDLQAATAHLDRARLLMAPHWPHGDIGESLCDWVGAQILVQEAEQDLKRATSAPEVK